jgi:histidinol-phosphate aminotransferase
MPDGTRRIRVDMNELPWGPLPAVIDAISAFVRGPNSINRYPDMRATELRAAIAAHHGLPVECVTVGTGSGGLLSQLTLASTRAGDEVLMPWPTFGQYAAFAGWTGATAVKVPLEGTTPSGRRLAAGMTSRTRMLVIASPNNPTGTLLRADGLQTVLDAAPPTCLVVMDQAYQDFAMAPHALDAAKLVASHANVAVLRTFSKAHGLAGLRVGYMLAQPETIDAAGRFGVPFNVDAIAQVAALASLRAFGEVQQRIGAIVAERERVVAELRRRGFGQANTQANFVWLPVGAAANALAAALEQSGVVTRRVPDAGVRVTIGSLNENDHFLDVFGAGDLVPGLSAHWELPTGTDAARVHSWIQQLLDAEFRTQTDVSAARKLLTRCEVAAGRTASQPEATDLDLPQLLHTIADVVADAPADALPRLQLELSALPALASR